MNQAMTQLQAWLAAQQQPQAAQTAQAPEPAPPPRAVPKAPSPSQQLLADAVAKGVAACMMQYEQAKQVRTDKVVTQNAQAEMARAPQAPPVMQTAPSPFQR